MYSEAQKTKIFNKICLIISQGNSLRKALREKNMPSSRVFYEWLDSDKLKQKQYARVTNERSLNMFEDILKIADSTGNDIVIDENGKEVTNNNVIQRDRLRVDSRKWMLSKMIPKKYGDKIDVTTGGDKITIKGITFDD